MFVARVMLWCVPCWIKTFELEIHVDKVAVFKIRGLKIPTNKPVVFERDHRLWVSSSNPLFRCTHLRKTRIRFLNHTFLEK